jgi:DNA-binding NtrC family response regulator
MSSWRGLMAEKIQVLVVDDEISILKSIAHVLKDKGLSVDMAENGAEALKKVEAKRFDIVITDYYMPVMNGRELLSIIKERFPRTLVIVISGFCTVEDRLDLLFKGAFNCIKKPFKVNELDTILNTAIKLCNNQSIRVNNLLECIENG